MPFINTNGWIFALRGVAAIVLGILFFTTGEGAVATFARMFGAYALIDAALNGLGAFRTRPRQTDADKPRAEPWWALLLEGVVSLIFGIVLLATAHRLTNLSLLYLLGPWAIVTGLFENVAAFSLGRQNAGKWLMATAGVLSVLFGFGCIMAATAGAGAVAWIGGYALLFGLVLVVLGLTLMKAGRHHEPSAIGPHTAAA